MTEWGLKIYKEGIKKKERVPSSKNFSVPDDLEASLLRNKNARKHFHDFPPSAKLAYVYWVNTAKTEETRRKRIGKAVEQLAQNKKLGEK